VSAAIWFSLARVLAPIVLGVSAFLSFGWTRGWMYVAGAVLVGFLVPGFWLDRKVKLRQKAIRNGLPDALDLLIVSLEAGSSLDGSIVKAGEELAGAHPALADELRLITTEIRAGKPRAEALKNFADRTRVADVRSLVSMLLQTDRFGTSLAQALRIHAATSRTKRRQIAEEKAAKVGVKLVFPLVFFLFPALYTVILGPLVIRILRVFIQGIAR
jgi:tight adherence protein C